MGKKLSLYMALALAVISLPAQAGYRDVVIADWPLSFWEFEDADSCDGCPCADTMCDYYPICSPGVYRGPGIELVPGPWGQAAELHGSGEFIQIYDNGRLESSPSCSLELLMKCSPTAEETYGRLISHANGGNSNYWIGITTAGSNPGQLSVGVPGTTWYTWPPILADSQWHHVVVTYTYVSDVNQTTTELWIDGISRGTSYSAQRVMCIILTTNTRAFSTKSLTTITYSVRSRSTTTSYMVIPETLIGMGRWILKISRNFAYIGRRLTALMY
jgi:hypothetical protein